MILKMSDRTEMFVSQAEGESIRKSLVRSNDGFITIRGTMIKKTAIVKLEEGGVDPRPQISVFDDRQKLAAGSCKSEKPIHRELMRIATQDFGDTKLLGDKSWREEHLKKLRKIGKWCEPARGTCACA